ncbi:MAG: glycosyltransferase [bacterium]
MDNIRISIIIPSYKDPLSMKTIRDLLDKSELGDQLEIIDVWDGFYPSFDIIQDKRVRYVHLGSNRGMRGAINAGIAVARGEFFARIDEHCCFGQGWDRKLTRDCKPNWIMTARRYFLDPEKWQIMEEKGYVDYEKLTIQNVSEGVRKFSGKPWKERTEKRNKIKIDETEAQQGSLWVANRKFFLETVGELQTEGYGQLIQDSVEVSMKYWKAGGKLMLNKNTWYAHKFRGFKRTHQNGTKENPANCDDGYAYSLKQWEKYYWDELRPSWDEKYAKE